MLLKNILYSTLWNKCPKCHQTNVFIYKNPYNLSHMSELHPICKNCGEKYEKEPGAFYGAMYVSYGLMVGWFVLCWAANSFYFEIETFNFLAFVIGSIILFMPVTFRISRLLWLNIFIRFDKAKAKATSKLT
ncbi:MAG: DUF983 domain-containing protein [Bacteroidetes bacterium]|nr:DUF983 domain-containing protein [Bacteroidota bacterium]